MDLPCVVERVLGTLRDQAELGVLVWFYWQRRGKIGAFLRDWFTD